MDTTGDVDSRSGVVDGMGKGREVEEEKVLPFTLGESGVELLFLLLLLLLLLAVVLLVVVVPLWWLL